MVTPGDAASAPGERPEGGGRRITKQRDGHFSAAALKSSHPGGNTGRFSLMTTLPEGVTFGLAQSPHAVHPTAHTSFTFFPLSLDTHPK